MYYSPYSGTDSNAGNPMIISIDELIKEGLLDPSDAPERVPVADVDFEKVRMVACVACCVLFRGQTYESMLGKARHTHKQAYSLLGTGKITGSLTAHARSMRL